MRRLGKRVNNSLKLVGESVAFALYSLKEDKFRTLLSLLGVTIGIFSIVAVFTIVDALKRNVETGLHKFGGSTIYIQPFPFAPELEGGEYKWWEYAKRPNVTHREFTFIKNNSKLAKEIAFASFSGMDVGYGRGNFEDGAIIGHTHQWEKLINAPLSKGRYFTPQESNSQLPIAIIGDLIAKELFPNEEAIGKEIKIGGKRVKVIAQLKEAGESIVNIVDIDNAVWLPLPFAATLFDTNGSNTLLSLNSKEGVDREEFLLEIRELMRSTRRLKIEQPNNFAINEMSFLLDATKELFDHLAVAGWIIAGFSILIGGVGIANIMFVSVKERSHQIGIQKALGARRKTILTQYLVEAAALSLSGGVAGIIIVIILGLSIGKSEAFPIEITFSNIVWGVAIAVVVGVVSGLAPALSATRLTPVEAINS
ncbi:MAG: ABC transporter permease [Bacteroidales bacterium]